MKTSRIETLLNLDKEKLIEKLLQAEKEIAIQHDLLKQTFLENKELQQKCAELEKELSESMEEGYSSSSSWVSKIVFALKKESRPLRSSDLISILERKEPMLKNHHSKAKFFSAYLNTAVKYQRVIQRKVNGVRGYYYILPEWQDESGNVKGSYAEMMI